MSTLLINALLPIALIIFTGYLFKHMKFPTADFWPKMDRFTYYVLMPSLLVYELAVAKINVSHTVNLVAISLSGIFLVLVLLMLLKGVFHFENRAFTSIVQGGIRFNTYVLLALVNALYGAQGLVLSAIVIAFAIPRSSTSCALVFLRFIRARERFR